MNMLTNAKHWYERGAEMRQLAENMENIETKAIMCRLADDYDKMGDRAGKALDGTWPQPTSSTRS